MSVLTLLLLIGCGSPSAPPASEAPAPNAAAAEAPAAEAPTAEGRREDVHVAEFVELQAAGPTIIDVRTDAEWDAGHIPGATHVPLDQVSPDHPALAALPKDEPVYFVCAVGGRSSKAADRMAKAGYRAVNVQGGTSGWIALGKPVETD